MIKMMRKLLCSCLLFILTRVNNVLTTTSRHLLPNYNHKTVQRNKNMKYTLYIAAFLLFSYNAILITSDKSSSHQFTRRHYMHSDGTPGILTMNAEALAFFQQYPWLLPALLNSTEEVRHNSRGNTTDRQENSARSPQTVIAYNAGQPYTGAGRTERVWPQASSTAESAPQPTAEIAEQKTGQPDIKVIAAGQKRDSGKTSSDIPPSDDDSSSSDESDYDDDRNFIPYRTINIRSSGCWQRFTHRLFAWCRTRTKDA